MDRKRAIIIGSTSGIGRALAIELSNNGYIVGIVGRRLELLTSLKDELRDSCFIKQIDITQITPAIDKLNELINEMGNVELIVLSSGTGYNNVNLDWEMEYDTISVNVLGTVAMANVAMKHFEKLRYGHLIGISSISALFSKGNVQAYNASKAFLSNYLAGLRNRAYMMALPISITDIKPGFVKTAMAKSDHLFWVASPEKAAKQIYRAIKKKRKMVYISKRWRLIAWLFKIIPNALLDRVK